MVCWLCLGLGRQEVTYYSFWSTQEDVQKEGHIRIVKRVAIINGEVPDVFSVGQILLPLPVSCSFCEKRTSRPSRFQAFFFFIVWGRLVLSSWVEGIGIILF